MNKALQEIGDELADIHQLMEGLQACWGDDGGELWQMAEAVKGLTWVVHGLAKSVHAARLGGGADD
jgi:hypothetical protein